VIVHRIRVGNVVQHGLLLAVNVPGSARHSPFPHELTRTAKVDSLAAHLAASPSDENPVMLFGRGGHSLAAACREVASKATPLLSKSYRDEEEQSFFVDCPELIARFVAYAEELGDLVIADGHHRIEALRQLGRAEPDAGHEMRLLALVLPGIETVVRSYDRIVSVLPGVRIDACLAALERSFSLRSLPEVPDGAPLISALERDEIMVIIPSGSYALRLPAETREKLPLAFRLQRDVLAPQFGLLDPQTSDRIEFVPGGTAHASLRARLRASPNRVAFVLPPPTLEEILECVGRQSHYPPHSTYFPLKPSGAIQRRRLFTEDNSKKLRHMAETLATRMLRRLTLTQEAAPQFRGWYAANTKFSEPTVSVFRD